eukprot:1099236_1
MSQKGTARKRTPTRTKFISFYRLKESQTYELKKRRKLAVSKGKKCKQTTQKLHYEVNKLKNDLTFERKKNCALSAELSMIRDQKKQREEAIATLTNDITSLKLSLSETIQSYQLYYQQTHSVADQMIQHEKLQEKLKCFIRVEENERKVCNLSVLRVEFLDASVDVKSISFQWKRSYGTELMSIKNANEHNTSYPQMILAPLFTWKCAPKIIQNTIKVQYWSMELFKCMPPVQRLCKRIC